MDLPLNAETFLLLRAYGFVWEFTHVGAFITDIQGHTRYAIQLVPGQQPPFTLTAIAGV